MQLIWEGIFPDVQSPWNSAGRIQLQPGKVMILLTTVWRGVQESISSILGLCCPSFGLIFMMPFDVRCAGCLSKLFLSQVYVSRQDPRAVKHVCSLNQKVSS